MNARCAGDDALVALRDTSPLVVSLAALNALAVMVWQTQAGYGEPGQQAGQSTALTTCSTCRPSAGYLSPCMPTRSPDSTKIRLHTHRGGTRLVDDLPTADFQTALGIDPDLGGGTAARLRVLQARYRRPTATCCTDTRFTEAASWRSGIPD